MEKYIKDFPLLTDKKEKNTQIYFDSACMSLKPRQVIKAMEEYYFEYPACAGRSSHRLGDIVTRKIKETRKTVAEFINAKNEKSVVFVRNTTEALNLLADSIDLKSGDTVLITDKEHNSNLIPWQEQVKRRGINLKIAKSNSDGTFDIESFNETVRGVKLVSMAHTSNLDGVTIPAKEIVKIAHKNDSIVILDAAQSAPHCKIDVQDLDVDFLAFSGHKMLGPTGTGILYGKYELLNKINPYNVGGNTIEDSTYQNHEMLLSPEKFEAGLQDYAGIIGFGEAVKYLKSVGFENIARHELLLNGYITEEIVKMKNIRIIGPADPALRSGIVSFYIQGVNMHQIALMLDQMAGVMVRSGRHCVHSWFNYKGIENSARASLYFYNTLEESEIFIETLRKIMKLY